MYNLLHPEPCHILVAENYNPLKVKFSLMVDFKYNPSSSYMYS